MNSTFLRSTSSAPKCMALGIMANDPARGTRGWQPERAGRVRCGALVGPLLGRQRAIRTPSVAGNTPFAIRVVMVDHQTPSRILHYGATRQRRIS